MTTISRETSRRNSADPAEWDWFIGQVRPAVENFPVPSVTEAAGQWRDPFKILIATLISLRTRDEVTAAAAHRLFAVAATPEAIIALGEAAVSKLILPANYHVTKASKIVRISEIIRDDFGGRVPDDLEVLKSLPGVGPKTANLVLSEGFDIDAICVDTHVHRIPNRFGLIATRNPVETEKVLREKLPVRYWKDINRLLVPFGQIICTPVSPRCSICPISERCARLFDGKSR
jgi:endonuclease-3